VRHASDRSESRASDTGQAECKGLNRTDIENKAKVKLSRYTMQVSRRERLYSSYSFFTSVLDGMYFQCHPWGKDPSTHLIGGWVGLRTGLDIRG
jgi:hypothetical protein